MVYNIFQLNNAYVLSFYTFFFMQVLIHATSDLYYMLLIDVSFLLLPLPSRSMQFYKDTEGHILQQPSP